MGWCLITKWQVPNNNKNQKTYYDEIVFNNNKTSLIMVHKCIMAPRGACQAEAIILCPLKTVNLCFSSEYLLFIGIF